MPAQPVPGAAATLAARLRALSGPFRPEARLDPSQVVDQRAPEPMDWLHFEDGTTAFVPSPRPGGISPTWEQHRRPPRARGGRAR